MLVLKKIGQVKVKNRLFQGRLLWMTACQEEILGSETFMSAMNFQPHIRVLVNALSLSEMMLSSIYISDTL